MELVSNVFLGGLKVRYFKIIDLRQNVSPRLNHVRTLSLTGMGEGYFLSSGNEKWDIRELLKNIYWKQEIISAIMNTGGMD
jgi:hypothetical protein